MHETQEQKRGLGDFHLSLHANSYHRGETRGTCVIQGQNNITNVQGIGIDSFEERRNNLKVGVTKLSDNDIQRGKMLKTSFQ